MPESPRNVWRLVRMFHQKLRVLSRNKGDNDRSTSVLDFEMTTRITVKFMFGTFLGWGNKNQTISLPKKCNSCKNRTLVRQTGARCYARMQIPRPLAHRDLHDPPNSNKSNDNMKKEVPVWGQNSLSQHLNFV